MFPVNELGCWKPEVIQNFTFASSEIQLKSTFGNKGNHLPASMSLPPFLMLSSPGSEMAQTQEHINAQPKGKFIESLRK